MRSLCNRHAVALSFANNAIYNLLNSKLSQSLIYNYAFPVDPNEHPLPLKIMRQHNMAPKGSSAKCGCLLFRFTSL
ncbi:hypothetical protein VTH8203_02667 [Vibrio thalassae]|uniref:Uncharacterized protein n=1 Tax=Vibrio thalassae TaxID=1243014 RepID=A0A240EM34_9VIBR|nr:hypothetical protein VTH8203_02667 [Vibrio thalassae]